MRILLLQELVDAVQIVEGVVDEEAKFGDDAQLVVYTLPQFVADGLLVGIDVLQQLFPLFRWEYAEIRRASCVSASGRCLPALSGGGVLCGSVLFPA